jgi:hypothetical protein
MISLLGQYMTMIKFLTNRTYINPVSWAKERMDRGSSFDWGRRLLGDFAVAHATCPLQIGLVLAFSMHVADEIMVDSRCMFWTSTLKTDL